MANDMSKIPGPGDWFKNGQPVTIGEDGPRYHETQIGCIDSLLDSWGHEYGFCEAWSDAKDALRDVFLERDQLRAWPDRAARLATELDGLKQYTRNLETVLRQVLMHYISPITKRKIRELIGDEKAEAWPVRGEQGDG